MTPLADFPILSLILLLLPFGSLFIWFAASEQSARRITLTTLGTALIASLVLLYHLIPLRQGFSLSKSTAGFPS